MPTKLTKWDVRCDCFLCFHTTENVVHCWHININLCLWWSDLSLFHFTSSTAPCRNVTACYDSFQCVNFTTRTYVLFLPSHTGEWHALAVSVVIVASACTQCHIDCVLSDVISEWCTETFCKHDCATVLMMILIMKLCDYYMDRVISFVCIVDCRINGSIRQILSPLFCWLCSVCQPWLLPCMSKIVILTWFRVIFLIFHQQCLYVVLWLHN